MPFRMFWTCPYCQEGPMSDEDPSCLFCGRRKNYYAMNEKDYVRPALPGRRTRQAPPQERKSLFESQYRSGSKDTSRVDTTETSAVAPKIELNGANLTTRHTAMGETLSISIGGQSAVTPKIELNGANLTTRHTAMGETLSISIGDQSAGKDTSHLNLAMSSVATAKLQQDRAQFPTKDTAMAKVPSVFSTAKKGTRTSSEPANRSSVSDLRKPVPRRISKLSTLIKPVSNITDSIHTTLITNHKTLKPLYQLATQSSCIDQFRAEFAYLISQYAKDLAEMARGTSELNAAGCVRHMREQMIREIVDTYFVDQRVRRPPLNGKTRQQQSSVGLTINMTRVCDIRDQVLNPLLVTGSDSEFELQHERTLEQFLTNGRPFANLCQSLELLVYSKGASENVPSPRLQDPPHVARHSGDVCISDESDQSFQPKRQTEVKESYLNGGRFVINFVSSAIRKAFRPTVKAGYRRMEWTCSCGEAMYGDFSNTNPPAIDSLEIVLKQMANTPKVTRSDTPSLDRYRFEPDAAPTVISQESGNRADLSERHYDTRPSQAVKQPTFDHTGHYEQRPPSGIEHRPSSTSSSSATEGILNMGIPLAHIPTIGGSLSRSQLAAQFSKFSPLVAAGHGTRPLNQNVTRPKFFELCVNYSRWQRRLGEIDISQCSSDGQLFDAVKRKYVELRKQKTRSLLEPVDIRYVRFSIQPSYVVGILSKPEETALPPKVEVDEQRYEYQPCPLLDEPPMPSNVLLHHLASTTPEAHPYSIWTSRLPKKIDDSIFSNNQPIALGWGIHIVEGVDQIKVAWITICGLLTSCIATGLWWGLKKDIQGGTGLGSLMLTMLGLMIAYFTMIRWHS